MIQAVKYLCVWSNGSPGAKPIGAPFQLAASENIFITSAVKASVF